MNDAQKRAAELAEIMLAYSRGEKIQILNDYGKFIDLAFPQWDFEECVYRVKPKPREWWEVRCNTNTTLTFYGKHKTLADAQHSRSKLNFPTALFHVREVLED